MELTIIKEIRTNNFKVEQLMQKIANMWKDASTVLDGKDNIVYGIYYLSLAWHKKLIYLSSIKI